MEEQKQILDQEIWEISLRIERDGRAFYKELEKLIDEPTLKSFIHQMANEESKHIKLCKSMLEKKKGKVYGWEDKQDVKEFINSQFQTDIFPKLNQIKEFSSKLENLQKAFEFALEAEKVSAEFYALLGEYCEDFEAKTTLALLEQAEQDHIKQVIEIRNKFPS